MLNYVKERFNQSHLRSFCLLHNSELPFCNIVADLDGPTSSNKGSKIGKLFSKLDILKKNIEF